MSSYERQLVEHLLPTLWDPGAVFGVDNPQAPPADMPRGSSNKKEGNTFWAHLVDIRTAWAKTELTLKERRALFLRFALDLTEEEVGKHEGVTKQTISERLFVAVGKMVACLNGGEFTEELPAA